MAAAKTSAADAVFSLTSTKQGVLRSGRRGSADCTPFGVVCCASVSPSFVTTNTTILPVSAQHDDQVRTISQRRERPAKSDEASRTNPRTAADEQIRGLHRSLQRAASVIAKVDDQTVDIAGPGGKQSPAPGARINGSKQAGGGEERRVHCALHARMA